MKSGSIPRMVGNCFPSESIRAVEPIHPLSRVLTFYFGVRWSERGADLSLPSVAQLMNVCSHTSSTISLHGMVLNSAHRWH
jgi:hypothetical protein